MARIKGLDRSEFYLFDKSAKPPESSPHKQTVDAINDRPNCEAQLTSKFEMENYLHPDAIKSVQPQVAVRFGDFDDVPSLVVEAIHCASESSEIWNNVDEEKKRKKISRAKAWLNEAAAAAMTPQLLTERDPAGDIRRWLSEIAQLLER